jgi:hypothetical protein
MIRSISAAALVAIMAGCASAPETQPTHYWESSKVSENRYKADNMACQTAVLGAPTAEQAFDAGSESFDSYRECMVSRGYVLRQY